MPLSASREEVGRSGGRSLQRRSGSYPSFAHELALSGPQVPRALTDNHEEMDLSHSRRDLRD